MDKGLQEVIAKLNQQKPQVSQQISKPIEKPMPKQEVAEAEVLEDNDDVDDTDFYEDDEQKAEVVNEKILKPEQKAEMEMELLNNNGRFRAELLFQLQELNKALSVIAQVLMQKR